MKQVVLDEDSFKALSSDSRVGILKSLRSRRRTLSELSKKMSLGTSTVKEHCDMLRRAELIAQIDEGRKWKYYELTEKGRQIVAPSLYDDLQVLITLCITVVVVSTVLFFSFGMMGGAPMGVGTAAEEKLYAPAAAGGMEAVATASIQDQADYVAPARDANAVAAPDIIPMIGAALLAGIVLGWAFKRRWR